MHYCYILIQSGNFEICHFWTACFEKCHFKRRFAVHAPFSSEFDRSAPSFVTNEEDEMEEEGQHSNLIVKKMA